MVDASNATKLVGWLIEAIDGNWPDGDRPDDLQLVDRDNSEIYDDVDSLRSRKGELQRGNYLSFGSASTTPTPEGPGYCLQRDDVVSCRLEGLHSNQYGHIDNPAEFEQLWNTIREAIYVDRIRPLDGYQTLFIENIRYASGDYRDYFRTDFEVRFDGREELP
jgi:hypothetical protein